MIKKFVAFTLGCLLGCLLPSSTPASTTTKTYQLTVNASGVLPCPQSAGTLTVRVTEPRSAGAAPLLVFYDATGTTDSATLADGNTVTQDVSFTWDFGDAGASGTGKWAYGSNPGGNSMNVASGIAAAHLYVVPDGAGNQASTAKVTATDGTNVVTCSAPAITTYDDAGSNGFPGPATTCVFASSLGSGCPAGASVLNSSTFSVLNTNIGGKRYLFKCGDTFTGDNYVLSGVRSRVGAYGGCQGTKLNRPIFSDTAGLNNDEIDLSPTVGDLAISDIDFHGNNTASNAIYQSASPFLGILYQVTLYNLNTTGTSGAYGYTQGAQYGVINSAMQNMRSSIGVYFNIWENNPPYSGNTINNLDYAAALGNLFNGVGNTSTGAGQEVFRISACRMCAIENNTIENANNIGGVIKIHEGNTYMSCWNQPGGTCYPCTVGPKFVNTTCWTGAYTELTEVSDNWFGGTSGGVLVDVEPQSAQREEHLRLMVFERNIYAGPLCCEGSPGQMRTSVVNLTVRSNAFYDVAASSSQYPQFALNVGQLGNEPVPTGVEVFNNTFYMPNPQDNAQGFIAFNGLSMNAPPQSSFIKNNLFYVVSGSHSSVANTGAGNTISNNSVSNTANPGFTNGSTTFTLVSDYKPSANFSGATPVPVWFDGVGVAWPPTWSLGAVHP